MTKKLAICCILLLMSTAGVFAQSKDKHNEIAVSYGFVPITNYIDGLSDAIISIFTTVITENEKYTGALNLSYNYRLTKKLGIGAAISYAGMKRDITIAGGDYLGQEKLSYISILPRLKAHWVNGRILSLYSSVAAGVIISQSKLKDRSESQVEFGWQISPLGLEVGNNIAGFAEVGIGQLGSAIIGVRVRF